MVVIIKDRHLRGKRLAIYLFYYYLPDIFTFKPLEEVRVDFLRLLPSSCYSVVHTCALHELTLAGGVPQGACLSRSF